MGHLLVLSTPAESSGPFSDLPGLWYHVSPTDPTQPLGKN